MFFKVPAQKCLNKVFLVWNLGIFIISWNFAFRQFKDANFKCDNNMFKFEPQNMQILHFSLQINKFLFFAQTLQHANWRVLSSSMTTVFDKYDHDKYDNSFWIFQPIDANLPPILGCIPKQPDSQKALRGWCTMCCIWDCHPLQCAVPSNLSTVHPVLRLRFAAARNGDFKLELFPLTHSY